MVFPSTNCFYLRTHLGRFHVHPRIKHLLSCCCIDMPVSYCIIWTMHKQRSSSQDVRRRCFGAPAVITLGDPTLYHYDITLL